MHRSHLLGWGLKVKGISTRDVAQLGACVHKYITSSLFPFLPFSPNNTDLTFPVSSQVSLVITKLQIVLLTHWHPSPKMLLRDIFIDPLSLLPLDRLLLPGLWCWLLHIDKYEDKNSFYELKKKKYIVGLSHIEKSYCDVFKPVQFYVSKIGYLDL